MSKQTFQPNLSPIRLCFFYYEKISASRKRPVGDPSGGLSSRGLRWSRRQREVDLERWHVAVCYSNDEGNEPASRPVMVASVPSRNDCTLLMLIICSCNSICSFCTVPSRSSRTAATLLSFQQDYELQIQTNVVYLIALGHWLSKKPICISNLHYWSTNFSIFNLKGIVHSKPNQLNYVVKAMPTMKLVSITMIWKFRIYFICLSPRLKWSVTADDYYLISHVPVGRLVTFLKNLSQLLYEQPFCL